jgi:hypothetical protein
MKLIDDADPNSFSSQMRRKRMRCFIELVRYVIQREAQKTISILDIGGTELYWTNFPFSQFDDVHFRITLLNLNYDPEFDLGNKKLPSNVSIEKSIGNACHLEEFKDKAWDIVHSNSVIEHVGCWEHIKAMAREIHRVGRYYFVQTPNYWFLVEPHYVIPFFQFLPRPIKVWILMRKKGSSSLNQAILREEGTRLLTKKEMRLLFQEGEILTERFFGLAKSIMARSFLSEKT